MTIKTFSPEHLFQPIGPYSHIAQSGPFIVISGTPGVDSQTGELAGPDAYSQAKQILLNFQLLLESVGASLNDVMQIHVYLKNVADFAAMNQAYVEILPQHRPARTVIAVADLPKKGALMTMDLTAFKQN